VATVVRLPEREAFLAFSGIYLATPLVVITRKDTPQLRSLDELEDLSVTLVEGYSSSQQLIALYPELHPSYVARPVDGLKAYSLYTTFSYQVYTTGNDCADTATSTPRRSGSWPTTSG